ncbi:unnamed protein product [Amoebophrya sp. A120]|nr:unnamed protein product [Amoebophrya sp. A120]|eukprot:GSA120T00002195001.1
MDFDFSRTMDSTFESSVWSELPPIDLKMRGWHLSDDPAWGTSRNEAMRKTAIKPSVFQQVAQSSSSTRRGSRSPPGGRQKSPDFVDTSKEASVKYDNLMAADMVDDPSSLRRYQLIPDPTRKRRFPPKSPKHRTPSDFLNYKKFQDTLRRNNRSTQLTDTSVDSVFSTSPGPLVEERAYTIHPADTYPGEVHGSGGRKSLQRKKTFASYNTDLQGEDVGNRDPQRMLPPKKKYEKELLSSTESSYVARANASERLKQSYDPTRKRSPRASPLAGPIDYSKIVRNIPDGKPTVDEQQQMIDQMIREAEEANRRANEDPRAVSNAMPGPPPVKRKQKTQQEIVRMGMFGNDKAGRAKAERHVKAAVLGESKQGSSSAASAKTGGGASSSSSESKTVTRSPSAVPVTTTSSTSKSEKKIVTSGTSAASSAAASAPKSKKSERKSRRIAEPEDVLTVISSEVASDVMADVFGAVETVLKPEEPEHVFGAVETVLKPEEPESAPTLEGINALLPPSERFTFGGSSSSSAASSDELENYELQPEVQRQTGKITSQVEGSGIVQSSTTKPLQKNQVVPLLAADPLDPLQASKTSTDLPTIVAISEDVEYYQEGDDGELEEEKRELPKSTTEPGPGHYNVKPMWNQDGPTWSMAPCPARELLRQGATNWLLKPSFDLGNPGPGQYGDVAGNKIPSKATIYMGMKPELWKPEVNDPQIPTSTHLYKPGGPYFTIKGKLPAMKSSVTFSFEYRPGKEFYDNSKVAFDHREFLDEFGSYYSLDLSKEASRFLSPEKTRRKLTASEMEQVRKMEARAQERVRHLMEVDVAGESGSASRMLEAGSSTMPAGAANLSIEGTVGSSSIATEQTLNNLASSAELLRGTSTMNPVGFSKNATSLEDETREPEASATTSRALYDTSIDSLESNTSLMFPPTTRIDQLRKEHYMKTRYKPPSYTQIGLTARNLDRYSIAGNDKRTTSFNTRPTKKRMDADQTNWYVQSSDCLISAGLRYAHPNNWVADPKKGFTLLGRDEKPFALPTAGKEVPLRDMGKYNSRTTRTKSNGFSWGASSRFGGLYC